MPLTTPGFEIMNRPQMNLMDFFGKLYTYTKNQKFKNIQPIIWQCSDESQGIKKSLFGYVFDCPVFNLGRVGALSDAERIDPASHHGDDLVILGGSHVGAIEKDGINYIRRINGSESPCCGMLYRIIADYLEQYKRAQNAIKIMKRSGRFFIILPYKYLHKQQAIRHSELMVVFEALIGGEAVEESSHGKVFPLNESFIIKHGNELGKLDDVIPIGKLLTKDTFRFIGIQEEHTLNFGSILNSSLFEFMPEIVASDNPHRRVADINTWREFHKIASYLTDNFLGKDRNILLISGLTIDHSTKKNTFVPQFGFSIRKEDKYEVSYYNPVEINHLLDSLDIYRPEKTYMEYAEQN